MKQTHHWIALQSLAWAVAACTPATTSSVAGPKPNSSAPVSVSAGGDSSPVQVHTQVTGNSMTISADGARGPLPRPETSCARSSAPRWTAPSGLNGELAHTTSILLDLGMLDPRGLPLVSARSFAGRFAGRDSAQPTVGWLVAASDARPAMLLSLRGDLRAIEATTSPLARIDASSLSRAQSWNGMRDARANGSQQHGFVSAALLAVSGDVAAANDLWRAMPEHGSDRSRAAMLELAELYFDSALAAYRAGRFAPAQEMTRVLECARPYIERNGGSLTATTTFEGLTPRMTQERSTEFLAAAPALAEELRRRSAAPSAPLEETQLATASEAALIAALDDVELDFESNGDPFARSPLLSAIRSRGAAIVPALIDALERDARWTRSIEHRSYPLARWVTTVRELLARLIHETAGMYALEFGWSSFAGDDARPQEVARALRDRWSAVRALSPFDRAINAIEDRSANYSRQILSVAWLFRSAPGQPSTSVLLRMRGPSVIDRTEIEGPALTNAQRERLVRALQSRAPGIGPLRDESPAVLEEEDRRCGYSQMMYLASPTLARSFVRETLDRAYARAPNAIAPSCASWLSAALTAMGDRDVATELARRVRAFDARDGELSALASWWDSLATRPDAQPVWEALAAEVSDVREWPVQTDAGRRENFVTAGTISLISRGVLRARPMREAVLRMLDETRTNAMIRFERGQREAQFLNPRGMRTLTFETAPDGADFIAPQTTERLRLADALADYLVRYQVIERAPSFDLRWTRERRDRAIAECKALLRAMP